MPAGAWITNMAANKIEEMAKRARQASRKLASCPSCAKNAFLARLADLLKAETGEILAINAIDYENAEKAGMGRAKLNRLMLTPQIVANLEKACLEIAAMDDPVGATETQWQRPNGLLVGKMRIPLGVIAMIYEARPNVTIDAAILCIKAGNAIILRGGKEALETNRFLCSLLRKALEDADLPADGAQLVEDVDHSVIDELCGMDEYIDVMIPRGGENLIAKVCAKAKMQVLKHYRGVCHVYIDEDADIEQALAIVINGKTQRPGVCNALEGVLVNDKIAPAFLPALSEKMAAAHVELRACARALPFLGAEAVLQKPEDRGREFLDLVLAVNIVDDMEEAVDAIECYGSRHTEIICTRNYGRALRFLREVDASMVGVNASTRFNDGGELGLGAEIGISTSKIHAYGPMGLKELTTTKFVVLGNGQIRE